MNLRQKVLQKCLNTRLYLDIKKYEFNVEEVKYLSFIINTKTGLYIDPEKIRVIKE